MGSVYLTIFQSIQTVFEQCSNSVQTVLKTVIGNMQNFQTVIKQYLNSIQTVFHCFNTVQTLFYYCFVTVDERGNFFKYGLH